MIEKTYSIYARKFDENSYHWTEDRESNRHLLKAVENYYNNRLKAKGYVFLRDIYEELDFPITQASIVVGWFYDPENKFADNRIDLSIEPIGEGPDFMLDFNVDGNITGHFN